ncbi:TPA: hypothetical protein DEP86_01650 [Candidatus Uhrbacteria bacterium]|nr:hypothetical protein [Candidatus Uhrbacteria bacterium]
MEGKMSNYEHGNNGQGHRRVNRIAVVIDFDNQKFTCAGLGMAFLPAVLMVMARELGEVIIASTFVDVSSLNLQERTILYKSGFELVDCPRLSRDKDTADFKIINHLGFLSSYVDFDVLLFASLDRDFIPAVQSVRNRGRQVFIVVPTLTSISELVYASDGYLIYENRMSSENTPLRRASIMLKEGQTQPNGDHEAFKHLMVLRQIVGVLVSELKPSKPLGFFTIVKKVEEALKQLGVESNGTKVQVYLDILKWHDVLKLTDVPVSVNPVTEGTARRFYRVDTDHVFVTTPLEAFQDQPVSQVDLLSN